MLIINADDFGGNMSVTNNTILNFRHDRITSASAMMYMSDTERSTELALETDMDIGLHLNLTEQFNGYVKSSLLKDYQQKTANYLLRGKYYFLLYNPLLKRQFEYIYRYQYEEFIRLYNREPTHIDGHHHMHLCMNMIFDKIIPRGMKIRRNFSFGKNEKNPFNRFYRHLVDSWIERRYICTDLFFDISPFDRAKRFETIVKSSKLSNVEIMVHPEKQKEFDFLMSEEYLAVINDAELGTFTML